MEPITALGTVWHIELFETITDEHKLRDFTVNFLEDFEQTFSRFRSDSCLSILNTTGVVSDPDEEFVALLQLSLQMYQETSGVFNIAVGRKMDAGGYDAQYSFVAHEETEDLPRLTEVLEVTDRKVRLKEGVKLDVGGIGKGYAIDALAQAYKDQFNLQFFLINGGGDIYTTSNCGTLVTVALAHPTDRELAIGTVDLRNQGFAASSPFVRSWQNKETGATHNHLHTDNEVASFVVGKSACLADVWATALAVQPELVTKQNLHKLLVQNGMVVYSSDCFCLYEM